MCCWNADDTLVFTFSSDHRTRVWRARDPSPLLIPPFSVREIHSCASVLPRIPCQIWDGREGTLLLTLANHADGVFNLRPHPIDPRILLTAGHDGRLFLLDLTARAPEEAVLTSSHLDDHLLCAAFAEDSSHIAVTDSIGVVHVFPAHLPPRDAAPVIPLDQFFETDWNHVVLEGGELVDELARMYWLAACAPPAR